MRFFILISLGLLTSCQSNENELPLANRWYTQSQVTLGSAIYKKSCMVCHGVKAQSVSSWRTPLPDGSYPPPPLNGTAHTWHHSRAKLKEIITQGNRRLDGKMPAFKHKLNAGEIEAVIAYVQTLWPEPIYQQWIARGGLE